MAQHKTNDAIREFQTILKAQPQSAPAHYYLVLARLQAGNILQAKQELLEAKTLAPEYGEIPQAQAAYEKALELNPRFGPAANNLAYIYSEHGGNKDKALALAQTAKEVLPEDPHVSDTLGWILYQRGIYERALSLLSESASKLGDNPEYQYHLGMAHYRLDNTEEAKKALAEALKLNAQFPGAEEAKQVLAEHEP